MAIDFIRQRRAAGCRVQLYSTVGVHPTRALEFLPPEERTKVEAAMAQLSEFMAPGSTRTNDDAGRVAAQAALAELERSILDAAHVELALATHVASLREVVEEGRKEGIVVAVGECGLDYDRLFFCPQGVQKAGFKAQLALAAECGLPLFLHNRNTGGDFADMMRASKADGQATARGVVHSFDGDSSECEALLGLGLDIGLNGCSLKTKENLLVASQVPLDRLHLETDAPWCGIKRSHAGFPHVRPLAQGGSPLREVKKEKYEEGACIKDRCEPCHIHYVVQVISGARLAAQTDGASRTAGDEEMRVSSAAYANSLRIFWPHG